MNLSVMEKWRDKKIAVLSPVASRTPPERYGAWETVASNITEGLVARGWDVTQFATADSITKARLHAVVPKGYEENPGADAKVAEYLHLSEMFEHADEFDLIHSHYDFMALSFSKLVKTPVLTTIHGVSSPKIMPVYEKYRNGNFISISEFFLHFIRFLYRKPPSPWRRGAAFGNFLFQSEEMQKHPPLF